MAASEQQGAHTPRGDGPEPSTWKGILPIGFAAGIVLILVGVVLNWIVVRHRLRAGGRVRVPLDLGCAARARSAPLRRSTPSPARRARRSRERFGRDVFLERTTLGLGALIGVAVTVPVVGFAVAPTFIDQGDEDINIGPIDELPGGRVARDAIQIEGARGHGLAPDGLHPQQRHCQRGAELHDPVEPLRPSRLPHPACGSNRRRRFRDDPGSRCLPRHADPDGALRVRVPLPRRRLRHRGQPGCRPAGAGSRSLQLLDHRRQRRARRPLQRRQGRRARERTR